MKKLHLTLARTTLTAALISAAVSTASAQTPRTYRAHLATTSSAAKIAHATNAALDDATIVAIFDAANTWDIQLGQLALKKSHNADIRTFAHMMVRDHGAVRKMGRELARRLNVTPTPPGADFPLAKDHASTLTKLKGLRGPAFDKTYIDHEVWYHQAVIDAITNTLLPATTNSELKALEIKVAPNFQAHLVAAKDVQQKLAK
ncbi:MAG: DUF4142 domain-containing protein [Gemmatimonadota bacterium]|nr:DUF4142 domain-containing protein [Gemmatimonadota bacterium]